MKKILAALAFSSLCYAMFASVTAHAGGQAGDDDAARSCPKACARIGACCGNLCC